MRSGLVCCICLLLFSPFQSSLLSGVLSLLSPFLLGELSLVIFLVTGLLAATLLVLVCENVFISPLFQRIFSLDIEFVIGCLQCLRNMSLPLTFRVSDKNLLFFPVNNVSSFQLLSNYFLCLLVSRSLIMIYVLCWISLGLSFSRFTQLLESVVLCFVPSLGSFQPLCL